MDDKYEPREPYKFAGYLTAMMGSLAASIGVLCIKLLPVRDTIQEMSKASMIRGLFMMLVCGASMIYRRQSFLGPPGEHMINVVRATLGAMAVLLIYVAIEFITMGECSALVYSSPVWTCLLSYVILNEPLPISLFLAVPMSFIGIILLANPNLLVDTDGISAGLKRETNRSTVLFGERNLNYGNITRGQPGLTAPMTLTLEDLTEEDPADFYATHRWLGIAIALLASLFMSAAIISFRYRNSTPIATCSFQFGAALAAIATGVQLVAGFGALPDTCLEWSLHFCIGTSSYALQYLFQWSLQFVPAGTFSVMRSLDIMLGFVMGAVFLDDTVLWTSVVGSILIMVMVVVLMLNDHIERALKPLWCFRCCFRGSKV